MKKYSNFTKHLKPRIWILALALLASLVYGISSGFGMPFIFEKVLPTIFEPVDGVNYSLLFILGIALLIPMIFLIRAVSGYISGLLMSYLSLEILRGIKQELFSKVQEYPLSFFDKHKTGDLFVRLSADTTAVQTVLLSFASEMVRQPIQVVGALGFLGYLCYTNGEAVFLLLLFLVAPLIIIPVQIMRKNLKIRAKQAQEALGDMTQLFNENLSAAHEVRIFNLQDSQTKKFTSFNEKFQSLVLKVSKYELSQQPMMEVLSALMISVAFVYAYHARINFETFAAIGMALYFTIDPTKRMIRMYSDFVKTGPLFDRLNEILDYQSTVPDPVNPVKIDALKGEIEFNDVSFAYGDKIVLKDVNIKIPAGTSCALVGESGAGKSTFAKLVMRFYDASTGSIRVDGINIKNISLKDLRTNLGSVPQYPVLFNTSVYDNIELAKEGSTKQEIYNATNKAFAHEFITELENGYDTTVGERGDRLSGGQKQRIAIARTFLKNAPILILDEATSALDSNSEAKIQKALDILMADRTVFVIAHRFSTIKNVKKIIVFKEGTIIDFGSHDELISRCSHYKDLYNRQASRVEV